MSLEEENVKKILTEYDTMRAKAENTRDRYVAQIYKQYPRLEQIRDEINNLGFKNIKNIMQNPEKSADFKAEFNKKLEELNSEKTEIVEKNNIPKDFEQPKYNCCFCNDTGYVGNKKCTCFKQKLIERAYSQSNLGSLLYDQSFDSFSLDYYSARIKPGDKISDREEMKDILKRCMDFAMNFENAKSGLFMIGDPGLGKTFLTNCIAKHVLDMSKTVVYNRATSLFSNYEDYRFGRSKAGFDFDRLYSADLLIIDDLGTENITKSGTSFFFDLLNERIDKDKKMIINSNFTMNEISRAYSARITSRIYEFFEVLHFKGEDIRIKKLGRDGF